MPQASVDSGCDLDDFIDLIHFALLDLAEDTVDVVWVAGANCQLQSLLILSALEVEWDPVDDLLFIHDQEPTQFWLMF